MAHIVNAVLLNYGLIWAQALRYLFSIQTIPTSGSLLRHATIALKCQEPVEFKS